MALGDGDGMEVDDMEVDDLDDETAMAHAQEEQDMPDPVEMPSGHLHTLAHRPYKKQ